MPEQSINPYEILGVARDADERTIQQAFRGIARETHPDFHPGDEAKEQRFKSASEAYETLRDAGKRGAYDRAHPVRQPPPFRQAAQDHTAHQTGEAFRGTQQASTGTPFYKKERDFDGRRDQGRTASPGADMFGAFGAFFEFMDQMNRESDKLFRDMQAQHEARIKEAQKQRQQSNGWFHDTHAQRADARATFRMEGLKKDFQGLRERAQEARESEMTAPHLKGLHKTGIETSWGLWASNTESFLKNEGTPEMASALQREILEGIASYAPTSDSFLGKNQAISLYQSYLKLAPESDFEKPLSHLFFALKNKDTRQDRAGLIARVIACHLEQRPDDLEKLLKGHLFSSATLMDAFKRFPENKDVAKLVPFITKRPDLITPERIESLKEAAEGLTYDSERAALHKIIGALQEAAQGGPGAKSQATNGRHARTRDSGPHF